MRYRLASLAVAAVVAGACSSGSVEPPSSSTTVASPAPTTAASPATSATATSTDAGSGDPAPPAAAAAAGIGDDYFPELGNPGYDVTHYTLDLVVDPATARLDGVVTIEAVITSPRQDLNLDFGGAGDLAVDAVTVDGSPAGYTTVGEDLVVALPAAAPADSRVTLQVEYGGRPGRVAASAQFGRGWITTGNEHYVVGEPAAGHSWFPSNDHPSDKATFTFRITVPDGVFAAAPGDFVEEITDLGQSTWVWEMPDPMATYLATVVIGDYAVVGDEPAGTTAGIPIRHVLPAGSGVADYPGLERLGEMVAYLSELFGPYPFDAYGIAIVDDFGAALENQTLALFDSRIAGSAFFENVLVHELAHQWFGDSVTPGRWQDVWLNEGFASYAEWLWTEREMGRQALEDGIAAERDEFAGSGMTPPGAPPAFDLFNGSVYRVGAMTLHALRLTVGDADFFEILRTYAARYAYANATTPDFIAVAEEVSATDLTDLFDSWLNERAVPEFPAAP